MKQKKIINILIPLALGLIIAIALYKIISIQREYQKAQDEYRELEAYVVKEPIGDPMPEVGSGQIQDTSDAAVPPGGHDSGAEPDSTESNGGVILHIDEDGLRAINEDYRAWLRIPSLSISYPLVWGRDNDYYLHYTFEGKYNAAGCLFIDCETASDFSHRNTFIYGHNMKNGSMFGSLKRFRNEQGLCASDPYFYIYQDDMIYEYEIFAYYTTEYTSDSYRLIDTEEEYDAYIADVKRLTEYVPERDMDFSGQPNIVTLSTCAGSGGTTKRMVVHGVLVNISERQ